MPCGHLLLYTNVPILAFDGIECIPSEEAVHICSVIGFVITGILTVAALYAGNVPALALILGVGIAISPFFIYILIISFVVLVLLLVLL